MLWRGAGMRNNNQKYKPLQEIWLDIADDCQYIGSSVIWKQPHALVDVLVPFFCGHNTESHVYRRRPRHGPVQEDK